jgi:hypothetical protein
MRIQLYCFTHGFVNDITIHICKQHKEELYFREYI